MILYISKSIDLKAPKIMLFICSSPNLTKDITDLLHANQGVGDSINDMKTDITNAGIAMAN